MVVLRLVGLLRLADDSRALRAVWSSAKTRPERVLGCEAFFIMTDAARFQNLLDAVAPPPVWPGVRGSVIARLHDAIHEGLCAPRGRGAVQRLAIERDERLLADLAWRVREVCRLTRRPLLPLGSDVLTFAVLWRLEELGEPEGPDAGADGASVWTNDRPAATVAKSTLRKTQERADEGER